MTTTKRNSFKAFTIDWQNLASLTEAPITIGILRKAVEKNWRFFLSPLFSISSFLLKSFKGNEPISRFKKVKIIKNNLKKYLKKQNRKLRPAALQWFWNAPNVRLHKDYLFQCWQRFQAATICPQTVPYPTPPHTISRSSAVCGVLLTKVLSLT